MSIKKRFVLFFVIFMALVIIITGGISIYFLRETYALFSQAPNKEIVSIMADKMLFKAILSFSTMIILVISLSIPLGIFLSRLITKPYLIIFQNLSEIAQDRLELDQTIQLDDTERSILEKYIKILLVDQEKLRDYEKVKSWKDGARLLMHEIKNPMTPLKLSAQSLLLQDNGIDEINSILTSVADIEKIMAKFKELVNIEFGPKEIFDFREFMADYFVQQKAARINFPITEKYVSENILIFAERTLLKMVLNNLIKNGMEANSTGFEVEIFEDEKWVLLRVITPDTTIENPAQIFRIGYSEKGKGRGFGLFLCKQISDYLDLNLKLENTNEKVVFSLKLKKVQN